MRETAKSIIRSSVLFLLLIVVYYLPIVLDTQSGVASDSRIRDLLHALFRTPAALQAVATNLLGHLVPILITFWALLGIGHYLSQRSGLTRWCIDLAVMFAGWVFLMSLNALFFPASNYSYAFATLIRPELAYVLGCMLLTWFLYSLNQAWKKHPREILVTALLVLTILGIQTIPAFSTPARSNRHIIIVGVDSLSGWAFSELRSSLPNLSGLIDSGTRYDHAYTPIGRTFPAWMSILSGKQPAKHGAIFNLRNLDRVEREDLISNELRKLGYRTVYAIDERRFNNIDESFGFDRIVGPHAGALDFLIQRVNDTPLTNLVLQTDLGKVLLPFSYANTASHPNYDSTGFVDSILDSIAGTNHLFLAVHFESAHHPFKTRHAVKTFSGPHKYWNEHAAALTVVDDQVGRLMSGLKQQGYLNDALVIVLSDHGEGLGDVEANITLGGKPTQIRGFGHGMNVMSDHQNRIVLAVQQFKNGAPVKEPTVSKQQVSLLDIRSSINEFVATGSATLKPLSECLVVETGLRMLSIADYTSLDETAVASSSAAFYEIDPVGRLRLREDRLPELIRTKDIGLRCQNRLTWWGNSHGRYFAISLDETGMPTEELPPSPKDIQAIEAYRQQLLATTIGAKH